jgi:hypothetical protein
MDIGRMDKAQIQALQGERFQAVWPHIAATPFYERKLRQTGLDL